MTDQLMIKQKMIGAMTLGGVDQRLDSSRMEYMDIDENGMNSMFSVRIRKIHVHLHGGTRLAGSNPDIDLSSKEMMVVTDDTNILNRNNVIVDSGTTASLLPKELKPALDKAWEKIMGKKFPSEAVEMSVEQLKKWPTIIFQMEGSNEATASGFDKEHPGDILVAFPPSSYMRLDLLAKKYEPAISMKGDVDVR